MSFTKVNGPGWGVNDKLTSAQINALDADHADSLDKVGGDTIYGDIHLDTAVTLNIDAGASLQVDGDATFGSGSQISNQSGSITTHDSGSTDTYHSGSDLVVESGCDVSITMATASCALSTTSSVPTTINLGASSYVKTAASTNAKIELGDGCADLVFTSAQTRTVYVYLHEATIPGSTYTNDVDASGNAQLFLKHTALTGLFSIIPIKAPAGSTLTQVALGYTPPATHTSLPVGSDFPGLQVILYRSDGDLDMGAMVYDTAASIAAYEAGARTLVYTPSTNTTIGASSYYPYIKFKPESGANAKINGIYHFVRYTYTFTDLSLMA